MLESHPKASAMGRMIFIDAEEVAAHTDPVGIKAAVARAFAALKRGDAVQPPQTLVQLPKDAGDFILYSAVELDCGLIGVKISPYLVRRRQTHGSPVTAYTLLLSVEDGAPVALIDSLMLTAHRTAATTSLALDHLVGQRLRKLAVIGAGPLARLHAMYELQSRRWEQVTVFSPGLAADPSALQAWSKDMSIDLITVARSAREAVTDADAAMLCTSSAVPVIDADWLPEDVVITSIGTNAFEAHEIDPAALSGFAVFCDLRSTAPRQAGDMIIAARDHGWDSSVIVADLPELVAGQRAGRCKGRRFFRSTGLGIADIAAAAHVLRRIRNEVPAER